MMSLFVDFVVVQLSIKNKDKIQWKDIIDLCHCSTIVNDRQNFWCEQIKNSSTKKRAFLLERDFLCSTQTSSLIAQSFETDTFINPTGQNKNNKNCSLKKDSKLIVDNPDVLVCECGAVIPLDYNSFDLLFYDPIWVVVFWPLSKQGPQCGLQSPYQGT